MKNRVHLSWSISLLVLLSTQLSSCVPKGGRVAKGDKDQILYYGNGSEPQDLDPQTVTGVIESVIFFALFEGLVNNDPVDLHPIPGVAQSWDISQDQKVYTFHLRHNAKWSDGTSLTSKDFINSYKRILNPNLAAEYAQMFFEDVQVVNAREYYEGKIKDFSQVGFEAPDNYTLIVKLVNPASYFLSMLTNYCWYPVPISTIAKFGPLDAKGSAWTRPGNLISNGPFILKKWLPQQEVVVEKNPNYWNASIVKLKSIHYYPTENLETEERDFRAGLLHVTTEVPDNKIEFYKKHYPQFLQLSPYLGTYFYRININNSIVKDKRIRRALAMAIDREAIVKNITRGGQKPAFHFTPPDTNGYTAKAHIPYDIEAAKALLADAGYPGGKGLPTIEILINTSQEHRAIAEAIQEMWRSNLNIDVRIVNEEWKVYLDTMNEMNFCIARAGWIGDYNDPNSFLSIMISGNGNNDTGFSNLQYDSLLHKAGSTQNPQERDQFFQQAEAILMDEAPVIPIYFYVRDYLIRPSVKGWYPNILDRHPPQYIYLDSQTEFEKIDRSKIPHEKIAPTPSIK